MSAEKQTEIRKLGAERLMRALNKYGWKAVLIKDLSREALPEALSKEWLMEEERKLQEAKQADNQYGETFHSIICLYIGHAADYGNEKERDSKK